MPVIPHRSRALISRRSAQRLAAALTPISLALAGCSDGGAPLHATRGGSDVTTTIIRVTDTTTHEVATTQPPTSADPAAVAAWEALMGTEGEYAAAASYQVVLEAFGPDTEPYRTILEGEQVHIQALTRQLERHGVQVPENPYIGQIAPPSDLRETARAWAASEAANVMLYDTLMVAARSDSRLSQMFLTLRRTSEQEHLPMFREAAAGDGTLSTEQMARYRSGSSVEGRDLSPRNHAHHDQAMDDEIPRDPISRL